ncbi:MAG: pyridoxamine 5'-phosphate oxidase family protein [Clostridia bacterium]|nr:pyridoxamine 5'-phosphate oxidase family protein [Clostridia bacterium]
MYFPQEAKKVMNERFGRDTLIALATVEGDVPAVRAVNAYYEDGAFYVVTYGLSNKMKQLQKNPNVAVCGDWFTGRGRGEDLGHVLAPENAAMMEKLRTVFAAWYTGGHVNEADPQTRLLCIRLTTGTLYSHGTKYELEFV